jgi:Uma2 family endonuclease
MALDYVYDDDYAIHAGLPMTREDFDRLIAQGTDYRYEWVKGRIYLMAPPSPQHIFLADGIIGEFRRVFGVKGPCRPYHERDVEIPPYRGHPYGAVKRPDVIVSCAPSDFFRKREKGQISTYARYPRIIVEILSEDSTAQADRTTKFNLYKQLPSLETYMLFGQTEMGVTAFRRETGWKAETFAGEAEIPLGPEGSLRLAEAYQGVLDQEE